MSLPKTVLQRAGSVRYSRRSLTLMMTIRCCIFALHVPSIEHCPYVHFTNVIHTAITLIMNTEYNTDWQSTFCRKYEAKNVTFKEYHVGWNTVHYKVHIQRLCSYSIVCRGVAFCRLLQVINVISDCVWISQYNYDKSERNAKIKSVKIAFT